MKYRHFSIWASFGWAGEDSRVSLLIEGLENKQSRSYYQLRQTICSLSFTRYFFSLRIFKPIAQYQNLTKSFHSTSQGYAEAQQEY
jgi:hypothetical protein